MSLNDLLKGLAVFEKGVSDLAVSRTINKANEELTRLQFEEAHAGKQLLEQRSALAADFGMRLTQAGADQNQVQSLTSLFAPSQGAQFQAKTNEEAQKRSFDNQMALQNDDQDFRLAMKDKDLQALGLKGDKKASEFLSKRADKFRQENKDLVQAQDKVNALRGILDTTPDRLGIEMAKTGLLKLAGEDRVSDADVARAQKDPSLRAGIARRLKLELTGEALKSDREFYQAILNVAEQRMQQRLRQKVDGFAAGEAELSGIDGDLMKSALTKQLNLQQKPNDKQAKIQKLQAWLASPEAKKNPEKAKKAAAALAKLQEGQ